MACDFTGTPAGGDLGLHCNKAAGAELAPRRGGVVGGVYVEHEGRASPGWEHLDRNGNRSVQGPTVAPQSAGGDQQGAALPGWMNRLA